jgi:hypothetical protein
VSASIHETQSQKQGNVTSQKQGNVTSFRSCEADENLNDVSSPSLLFHRLIQRDTIVCMRKRDMLKTFTFLSCWHECEEFEKRDLINRSILKHIKITSLLNDFCRSIDLKHCIALFLTRIIAFPYGGTLVPRTSVSPLKPSLLVP